MNTSVSVLLLTGFLCMGVGCGGETQNAGENIKAQTQGKLEAMKQLAEAIEKKDPQQISGAIEGIVSSNMDAATYPDAAREFIDIYNKKVKGKLKGDEAIQVKSAVDELEKAMKAK